ncbi:hypothetical protein HZA97_05180 [Candidatus Woesearchaeota archaeon]|nr:hypothetical protein [Candidatus Woesearchaeota archaeon]
MSLKDVIEKAKINGYDLGRGIVQGIFAFPTYDRNIREKNYSSNLYTFGKFSSNLGVLGVCAIPLSMIASIGYPFMGEESQKFLLFLIKTSATIGIPNIASFFYEKKRLKFKKQTIPKSKTDIDPWCELKDSGDLSDKKREEKQIDPWVKLENKLQNGSC